MLKIGLWVAILIAFSWLYSSRAAAIADAAKARSDYANYRAEVNAKALERAEEQNRDAIIRQRNNERIANADLLRAEATRKRIAASDRAAASLRDVIAELERRAVPEDPNARAYADEASTARSLLERCSGRYQWVDGEAKKLGDQVTGLQEFIVNVCKAGVASEQTSPSASGALNQPPPDKPATGVSLP